MTIVVCIKCKDGVVIAADSMLTIGEMQQPGQKVHTINDRQLFAFAGDLSLAERFRAFAAMQNEGNLDDKLYYASHIAGLVGQNFANTGIDPTKANLATILVHEYRGNIEACEFLGINHRYLDEHHFTSILGSGVGAALPFLNFLLETFTDNRQPSIADGKLFATWSVRYAISRLAGGVGGDIDLATAERENSGKWVFRQLLDDEVTETEEAIQSAKEALIGWKCSFFDVDNAEQIPRADAG